MVSLNKKPTEIFLCILLKYTITCNLMNMTSSWNTNLTYQNIATPWQLICCGFCFLSFSFFTFIILHRPMLMRLVYLIACLWVLSVCFPSFICCTEQTINQNQSESTGFPTRHVIAYRLFQYDNEWISYTDLCHLFSNDFHLPKLKSVNSNWHFKSVCLASFLLACGRR